MTEHIEATIKPLTADNPEAQSADILAGNIEQLKTIFPEAFTEGKIDFEVLRQLLGGSVEEQEEKYGLNWHGKRKARQLALTPSTSTLRPCPEESVDWDTTKNLMIEGDNLEVLKLLQKSYSGKVKLIYIDPPDNFQDNIKNYLELTGQVEGGRKISSNTEASGRFHTDWLNMMYPRLKLARNLLREDGVIFISIDEKEYSALHLMCCDIFGEENIVGTVVWKNATDNNPTNVAIEHEYLFVVAKKKDSIDTEWKSSISDIKDVLVQIGDELTAKLKKQDLRNAYNEWFWKHKIELWPLDRYKYIDEGGVYTGSQSVHNPGREGYRYDVPHPVTKLPCKQPLMGYRFPPQTMAELIAADRILFGDDESKIIELKVYVSEFKEKLSSLLELDGRLGAYDLKEDFPTEGKVFTNPKPVRLYEAFLPFLLKDNGDLIADFFAGSGATAKAVWKLNSKDSILRKFCLVQLPEPLNASDKDQKAAIQLCDGLGVSRNISEITKERLRRAAQKIKDDNPLFPGDLGFRVFKLDSSNINTWKPDRNDLETTLFNSIEHLKADRSEADILYELVCLATHISRDEVEPLAKGIVAWHKELAPAGETTSVFRDSAFADDVAKTNLAAILQQHGLEIIRSL